MVLPGGELVEDLSGRRVEITGADLVEAPADGAVARCARRSCAASQINPMMSRRDIAAPSKGRNASKKGRYSWFKRHE